MKFFCKFLFLLLLACANKEEDILTEPELKPDLEVKSPALKLVPAHFRPIYAWLSNDFYPFFNFNGDSTKIHMNFYGQYLYKYPVTKITNSKFSILYAQEMDCIHEMGVNGNYGLNNFPVIGKPFLKCQYINEDSLVIDFLYPEWTDSVNAQLEGVLVFDHYFHRIDWNSK